MNEPRCRHLRTKAMYVSVQAPDAFNPANEPVCWCNRTLHELGPDDSPVHPSICQAPRDCFEKNPGTLA